MFALATVALAACNDNFELPPFPAGVQWDQNTNIAQFKTEFYRSDRNYVETVGNYNNIEDSAVIIRGRIVSDISTGNIYNSIVIQSDGADGQALNIAVRTNNLTKSYEMGQEIIVNATGLKIGNYNGLLQLGAEGTYNNAPSMTFMESDTLEAHSKLIGDPDPSKIDTAVVDIATVNTAKSTQEGLLKWQSRLVRFDNVSFVEQGVPLATDQNTNRYVKDASGNELNVRTSSYASFKATLTPGGTGSVVGILSYYGTDWQLLLNDDTGLIGFTGGTVTPPDEPSTGDSDGTEEHPYSVANVQAGATGTSAWVKGYIVGWVEGQVLADGAHFDLSGTVSQTNILLADSKDVKDVAQCIPVQLPSGDVRTALNLSANPGNLGKQVMLQGSLEKYFGTAGLKSVTKYILDGTGTSTPDTPSEAVASINENFDASTNLPAGWTQVQVAGNKTWYVATFNSNNYASMTGYKGTAPFDQWLMTPAVDMSKATDKVLSFVTEVNGYGSTTSSLEVYVLDNADPTKATVKDKLSVKLATAPASGYSDWTESGSVDLSKYTGVIYIAFRYAATQDSNYATWCVDNVKVNVK